MRTKTTRPLGFALSALFALATLHAPLAAQGVTYTSIAKPEMAGAMGMLARLAPEAMAVSQPAGGMPELQVERTGKTRSFDGYTAEQVLVYTEMATGAEAETPEEGAGISRDFPGAEALKEVQDAMAAGGGADMAGPFAGDPAMMEAGRRIAEEMKGLRGIPVRTVVSSVMVPPGATFDREAVLAASDKPLQSGGAAAAAAAGGARQALGGLMGRRRQQEQPAPDAAPTQSVLMRVVQTVQDVKVGAIPDERFQVPAGYREVKPEVPRGE
jgi:hypothetical protein